MLRLVIFVGCIFAATNAPAITDFFAGYTDFAVAGLLTLLLYPWIRSQFRAR